MTWVPKGWKKIPLSEADEILRMHIMLNKKVAIRPDSGNANNPMAHAKFGTYDPELDVDCVWVSENGMQRPRPPTKAEILQKVAKLGAELAYWEECLRDEEESK